MPEPNATPQIRAFVDGEADRWFARNRHALMGADPATDRPLQLIQTYGLSPHSVLEIGAANGYRLAALTRAQPCQVSGVDPSAAAVADGRSRFPEVGLQVGRSDALPFDQQFDLVIVNFVFHWVDRSLVLKTVAEIDRVLLDGGFLLVGDFLPPDPIQRPYHHLPGQSVFTYMQNYASVFVASGIYQTIALLSGQHSNPTAQLVADGEQRVATWLLRKDLRASYAAVRADDRPRDDLHP